jgi:hypothetical protein
MEGGEQYSCQDSIQRHAQRVDFRRCPECRHFVCPESACAVGLVVYVDRFKNRAAGENQVSFRSTVLQPACSLVYRQVESFARKS